MVKGIKQGPGTVLDVLHFCTTLLFSNVFFLYLNFPSCSWLNFKRERPDNHQYVFCSGILLDTLFLHYICIRREGWKGSRRV